MKQIEIEWRVLRNDSQEMKELVDILQPENIICLGLDTSVEVIRIYPVAHPGYWGTMNRGNNNVEKDWMRIRK